MNARTISVGTELTFGITVDTNAQWLASQLTAAGWQVTGHTTIPDHEDQIADAIRAAAERVDAVIITGGLGPTADDRTRQGFANALNQPLCENPQALKCIQSFFERINRPMADSNRLQALVPRGAQFIDNEHGTAPGLLARLGSALIFALPGVPSEMKAMFDRSVRPALPQSERGLHVITRTLNCFGSTEAHIGEQIADLMGKDRNPLVNITAQNAVIRVRIIARGDTVQKANQAAEADAEQIRSLLGNLVFGENEVTLQEALADLLVSSGLTIAVAESCTGGLLAERLTQMPGASRFFVGGCIAYSNAIKSSVLDVSADLIGHEGAVSSNVAKNMAEGCRSSFLSDVSIAITGIAGPDGGTPEKPVGLVYVGIATTTETTSHELIFGAHLDRQTIRDRATKTALNILRLKLLTAIG